MKRELLIGYAMSFASFLLDSDVGGSIRKIILFGSVARGDFNKESDIDLFIDTDEGVEKKIERILILFRSSKVHETWRIKGIKNDISIKVGRLDKWSLRREVISSGVMIYGKYSELPEKTKYYALVRMDLKNIKTSKQMRIWRGLYGYSQKIGNKVYEKKGLLEESGGKKLGKAVIIIPMENRKEIFDFLNKNKVEYSINELWSDTF